ncbi:putative F-box domain-containing protein [Helianthus annuus]|nr:putative F-box domain-containing protein [Helianthus annuus]
MEDLLPDDLMCNVLSRLPVKTIIRYKCVCKKWRDLVSDSYFVNLHLSRSREALMIFNYYKPFRPGNLLWVEIGHKALVQVKRLVLTEYCAHVSCYWRSQVGSVNGLICSAYKCGRGFLIYNPVLEECMHVPSPPKEYETSSYGLGVSRAGEYKLIHIFRRKISLDSDELYAVEIEVYTLGTDKWRILGQTPFRLKSIEGEVDNGIFMNSHVYWIIHDQIYDFDLNTETFELFPSPPGDSRASMKMLGVLKGRLSGVSWCSLGLEVWVMKETSWYKERTIKENISHLLDHNSRPLCLIDGIDGTSILLVSHEDELMAHCLDTNKTLPLNMMCFDRYRLVTTYRPSFVKLDNFGSESVLADIYEDRVWKNSSLLFLLVHINFPANFYDYQ